MEHSYDLGGLFDVFKVDSTYFLGQSDPVAASTMLLDVRLERGVFLR